MVVTVVVVEVEETGIVVDTSVVVVVVVVIIILEGSVLGGIVVVMVVVLGGIVVLAGGGVVLAGGVVVLAGGGVVVSVVVAGVVIILVVVGRAVVVGETLVDTSLVTDVTDRVVIVSDSWLTALVVLLTVSLVTGWLLVVISDVFSAVVMLERVTRVVVVAVIDWSVVVDCELLSDRGVVPATVSLFSVDGFDWVDCCVLGVSLSWVARDSSVKAVVVMVSDLEFTVMVVLVRLDVDVSSDDSTPLLVAAEVDIPSVLLGDPSSVTALWTNLCIY